MLQIREGTVQYIVVALGLDSVSSQLRQPVYSKTPRIPAHKRSNRVHYPT